MTLREYALAAFVFLLFGIVSFSWYALVVAPNDAALAAQADCATRLMAKDKKLMVDKAYSLCYAE